MINFLRVQKNRFFVWALWFFSIPFFALYGRYWVLMNQGWEGLVPSHVSFIMYFAMLSLPALVVWMIVELFYGGD